MINSSELIVALDFEDRCATRSKYEPDTWAFALYSSFSNKEVIKKISFYIQSEKTIEDLRFEKWVYLLEIRIAYLVKFKQSNTPDINLYLLNQSNSKIKKVRSLKWSEILAKSPVENVYSCDELQDRKSKSRHDKEDKEQDRIICEIKRQKPKSFVFKEFPICFKYLGNVKNKQANRIDIVYMEGDKLVIIEIKVSDNKELDVIAQILDYYIYFMRFHKGLAKKGWKAFAGFKKINCLILDEKKHPLLEKIEDVYKSYGFSDLKMITKNSNGTYNGFI